MSQAAPPNEDVQLRLLNCVRGHFWEAAVNGDGAATCPTCGAPADTLPLLASDASGPAPPPPQTPLPPPLHDKDSKPIVAGYEVFEDLGRTTAGVAQHRARHSVLSRLVVLKTVLARDDPSQQAWGALRGEAAALAKLNHPNIVAIFEAGDRDRQLFLNAVELVEGPALGPVIAAKPLPVAQALALVEMLARAVQSAHDRGIVHRGLRPQTVQLQVLRTDEKAAMASDPNTCAVHKMLCVPKIVGFGLAKSRLVEGDVTDQELQDRIPSYLAPEQAWGRSKDIGTATDVYALGGILYECLTGKPPFKGSSPATTLEQIQTLDPIPISSSRKKVPADVAAIVTKCLHKQPRRRYLSARSLADDLRNAAQGKPVVARDANVFVRAGKWMARNPLVLLLALVVTAALAVEWGIAHSADRRVNAEHREAEHMAAERNALAANVVNLNALLEHSAHIEYLEQITRADLFLERNERDKALLDLIDCQVDQRGIEWHLLRNRVQEVNRELGTFIGPVTAMAWSSDGKQLAVAASNEIHGWQMPSRADWDRQPDAFVSPVTHLAFKENNNDLLFIRDNELQSWDRATGITRRLAAAIAFSVTPGGRSVLYLDGTNVRTLNNLTGERSILNRRFAFGRVTILPLDARLSRYVFADREGQVATPVTIFDGTREIDLMDERGKAVTSIACHPATGDVKEDSMLAIGHRDGSMQLYAPVFGTGAAIPLAGHEGTVVALAFSSDGKRLVSCGADKTVRVWDMETRREILTFRLPVSATTMALSPTGNRLALGFINKVLIYGDAGR